MEKLLTISVSFGAWFCLPIYKHTVLQTGHISNFGESDIHRLWNSKKRHMLSLALSRHEETNCEIFQVKLVRAALIYTECPWNRSPSVKLNVSLFRVKLMYIKASVSGSPTWEENIRIEVQIVIMFHLASMPAWRKKRRLFELDAIDKYFQ